MLYIKLHVSYFSNRKVARLKLKIGEAGLWLPIRLWTYAAENQPDGDFSGYEAGELAALLGYTGDAQAMLQALLETEFLDPDKRIHDWAEHNGFHRTYHERAKAAAKARWQGESSPTPPPEEEMIKKRGDETSNASSMLQACNKHPRPKKTAKESPPAPDLECFLNELQASEAYKEINVRREYSKMEIWCRKKKKQPTQNRFLSWLNRIDQPLKSQTNSITPTTVF